MRTGTTQGTETSKAVVNARASENGPQHFDWPLAEEAEQLLREEVEAFVARNQFAAQLAGRMRDESGTDFFEWIDHLVLPGSKRALLLKAGFAHDPSVDAPAGSEVFEHPRATLPRVLLRASLATGSVLALRPERVADFIAAHNITNEPEGAPFSRFRRVLACEEKGARLEAVERCAYRGLVPAPHRAGELEAVLKARELFATRPRVFPEDAEGFVAANRIADQAIALVARDRACQFFFETERAYWGSRNRAARVQKHRQDSLGLGWGNHDHHTFRCSREHFVDLIEFLLKLGFQKRERYYAGAEAGWGAQISEQPVTGIVVFADVDLMPEETQVDFSTQRLPPAPRLGTVGLWVGLHGESFLQAGLHHLEARFEFDCVRDQLKDSGVNMMKPFSDFPFLRQAFTEGERWPVPQQRLQKLLSQGLISKEQFEQFSRDAVIGSHLENLQRHGGFKGFNQRSVSVVIAATDPRRNQPRLEPSAA